MREQVQEAGETAADAAGRRPPAVRPTDPRRAQEGGAAARARHHHAVRPRQAAGRCARLRRRRRHSLRRARTACTTAPSTASSCGVPGKLRAIAEWAMENAIELGESWAYSDSYYDVPMLAAVQHPVVVNPDPRMLVTALVRRWPVVHLDVPAGVPKLPVLNIEPQRALMRAGAARADPVRALRHRRRRAHPEGGRRRSSSGNHRSYFDPMAMALALAKRGPAGSLPRQEGGVRRADRRPAGPGHGRDPRRARHRLGRAARGGRAGARGRRAGGDDAGGHDPRGARRSSIRCSRAGGARRGSRR